MSHGENCETINRENGDGTFFFYTRAFWLWNVLKRVQSWMDFSQAAHFTDLTDFKGRNRRIRPVLKSDYRRHETSIRAEVSASATQGLYTHCQKLKPLIQFFNWQKPSFLYFRWWRWWSSSLSPPPSVTQVREIPWISFIHSHCHANLNLYAHFMFPFEWEENKWINLTGNNWNQIRSLQVLTYEGHTGWSHGYLEMWRHFTA